MLLMAQNPKTAEYYHGSDNKEVEEIIRRGGGVVCFPGNPPEYVVFHNGTRYTTTILPEWINESEILHYSQPKYKENVILNLLNETAKKLFDASEEAYDKWEVKKLIKTIDSYSANEEHDYDTIAIIRMMNMLNEILLPYESINKTNEVISQLTLEFLNKLTKEFSSLYFPGDSVRKVMSLFMFFALHPEPLQIYKIATTPNEQFMNLSKHFNGRISFFVFDLKFYLSHPDLEVRKSLIVAKGAARYMRRQGKELCRTAIAETCIAEFYEHLYLAFINYRSAQQIYENIEEIGGYAPSIYDFGVLTKDELRDFWIETEEARVAILVSLEYAAVPRGYGPNPTKPPEFFGYIDMLISSLGSDETEMKLFDMTTRLICPEILRDIGLAWLQIQHKGELSIKTINRLKKIIERMESDLVRIVIKGDQNYLIWIYQLLEAALRKIGQEDESSIYKQKMTDPTYLQAIFQNKFKQDQ